MRRLFWVAVGATAGVFVVRRLTRAVESVSPAGLTQTVGDLRAGLRDFVAEVRVGMAEREQELWTALGLDVRDDGDGPSRDTPAGWA